MRTLVVSGEYPWPVNSGSRLRLATVLRGLASCGPVDLFSVLPSARTDLDGPDPTLGIRRVAHVAFDDRPPTGARRLAAALHPATPFELPRPDGGRSLAALARFLDGPYDLVWYFGMRPLVLSRGMVAAPTVLDLVDLEDHKIAARSELATDAPADARVRLRRAAARAFSDEEARRWRRLQVAAGRSVTATVVCSGLDADRARASGVPRVEVVANAYPVPATPVGREEVREPPTVLFQGTLRYPPNADAARFLVREVGPLLRGLVPGVRIRLVGTTAPGLESLADPPAVTLVGRVPDIAAELALADLVVVPVRFGSGTRLKILEAFAHRLPVVSTTLGAEGLGAVDGEHLLVADGPGDIAAACARLLGDVGLRRSLTTAAEELFRAHFAEDLVAGRVAEVARRVAGVSG
jgi:glycosyltransferase involved in cell wall biosynthesis